MLARKSFRERAARYLFRHLKHSRHDLDVVFFFSPGITGTRIGQASECFVYWKDPVTNDTWGLNFTSPTDARAFRECCVSLYLYIFPLLNNVS